MYRTLFALVIDELEHLRLALVIQYLRVTIKAQDQRPFQPGLKLNLPSHFVGNDPSNVASIRADPPYISGR